ncbi:hypothetical protein HRI_001384600 [Hibiscus trionum]|uniref:FAF domain-containing protein n=1 Tax=Hibiscus trionum TaxID=183268 RepID=A0A9W7HHU8_HIBTR|nr:hypothetical protein HRI_001384600 [Hibiscus trionum]
MQLGIEALTLCPKKNQSEKHCDFCMMGSSFVSPLPDASWVVGDYIGMESCFDLYNNEQVSGGERRVKRRDQPRKMEKREVPPPLPSLGRSQNQASHMAWVLKRYYTDDGRLVLREEKAKQHDYLRAHRSNGRLTLQLVPLDGVEDKEEEKEESIAETGKCMNYSSVRTSPTCYLGMPVPVHSS